MRAAIKIGALLASAFALAACAGEESAEQNITIDNGIDPNAEIEAVPTDETSTATDEELSGEVTDDNAAN